jgi:hypothetical protein
MAIHRFLTPRRLLVLAAVASLWALAAAASAEARTFARHSVWSTPLARKAPTLAQSDAMVQELRRQTTLPGGTWIDAEEWSTPVYTVPASQPRVPVALDDNDAALQADLEDVPLPPDAMPARGTDKHLVLRQPSTDTYWEFWGLTWEPDGWHADWGGKMTHASRNPGYFPYPFGATASGLPLLGGLMRLDELRAGRIRHALAFTIPEPQANAFVWPASRTDGTGGGGGAIPEGTRFRLDPALKIHALGLPPVAEMMAKAAQRYGMIVVDRGGAVAFKAEEPRQAGADPYLGLYGGLWPDDLLQRFPWGRLQVVAPCPAAFAAPTRMRGLSRDTLTGCPSR